MKKSSLKTMIILHVCLFLYSLADVCSKSASNETFLSKKFIIFYALIIIILGIYAIVWQQIIKKIPLSLAFANKAITIVWGILWGVMLFDERLNLWKIIGVILVISGIVLYSYSEKEDEHE